MGTWTAMWRWRVCATAAVEMHRESYLGRRGGQVMRAEAKLRLPGAGAQFPPLCPKTQIFV